MYISKNIFQTECHFVDIDEIEFFNILIKNAIDLCNSFEESDIDFSEKIDTIKKTMTPVIYASTVKNFKKSEDSIITRIELNKRIKSKYFIIDCDFENGEEEESNQFRKKVISFAKEKETPIIIYPTISYPNKPRFRCVFFTEKLMDEYDYYKCIKWFYKEIGEEPKDIFDFHIKNTNNAPIFVSKNQLKMIFNTSLNKSLKPLDNTLWKNIEGKRKKSSFNIESNELFDKIPVDEESFLKAIEDFAKSDKAKNYATFFPILYSLARAELVGQISNELAEKSLILCTEASDDEYEREKWKKDNLTKYYSILNKISTDNDAFEKTYPILQRKDFMKVWVK